MCSAVRSLRWLLSATLLCFCTASALAADRPLALNETEFSAGGFLKLHLLRGDITSAHQSRRGDQQLHIPHIPLDSWAEGDRDRSTLHAKDTRFWIRSVTPGNLLGNVELLYEADLHDAADTHKLRLRHAYLLADDVFGGEVLIGQTYTSFIDTAAIAESDSGIAVGTIVTRHRMLRWRQALADNTDWLVALEQPLNRISRPQQNGYSAHGSNRRPDLVSRLHTRQPWGSLSLAAMLREIRHEDPLTGQRQQDTGVAISLSGRMSAGVLSNLRYMISAGNALGRYSTLGTYTDAFLSGQDQLELSSNYSAMLSYQHYWTPQWRSSLTLSQTGARLPEHAGDELTRQARSLQLNLIWAPTRLASVGLEYLHGERRAHDGRRGSLNRLQLSTRINF